MHSFFISFDDFKISRFLVAYLYAKIEPHAPRVEGTFPTTRKGETKGMYFKRWVTKQILQKLSSLPLWVCWTHHNEGNTHCEDCLRLDGCWFEGDNTPIIPHHPHCHCTLDPIDYSLVEANAAAYSDYSKFDPYLFNTKNGYTHNSDGLDVKTRRKTKTKHTIRREII